MVDSRLPDVVEHPFGPRQPEPASRRRPLRCSHDHASSTTNSDPSRSGDIGGVVASANGPEAGVWVIAETTDLPTKFAKIVVTDDQGRYVMPDLPKAKLQRVGARLRLVDSPKVKASPASFSTSPRSGAECSRGGGILSGDLLVFDA